MIAQYNTLEHYGVTFMLLVYKYTYSQQLLSAKTSIGTIKPPICAEIQISCVA